MWAKITGSARLSGPCSRDRWEYSHVFRAVLAFVSLLLLVIAIAIG